MQCKSEEHILHPATELAVGVRADSYSSVAVKEMFLKVMERRARHDVVGCDCVPSFGLVFWIEYMPHPTRAREAYCAELIDEATCQHSLPCRYCLQCQ